MIVFQEFILKKKKLGLTEFLLDPGLRPYHPRSGLIMVEKTMVSPAADRPHAIVIPCPFLCRIKTTLKLAKLFHHRGFHITFVNTEFNQQRFLKSRGTHCLDGLPISVLKPCLMVSLLQKLMPAKTYLLFASPS